MRSTPARLTRLALLSFHHAGCAGKGFALGVIPLLKEEFWLNLSGYRCREFAMTRATLSSSLAHLVLFLITKRVREPLSGRKAPG